MFTSGPLRSITCTATGFHFLPFESERPGKFRSIHRGAFRFRRPVKRLEIAAATAFSNNWKGSVHVQSTLVDGSAAGSLCLTTATVGGKPGMNLPDNNEKWFGLVESGLSLSDHFGQGTPGLETP